MKVGHESIGQPELVGRVDKDGGGVVASGEIWIRFEGAHSGCPDRE